MKVLANGDYQLESGEIIPADQIGKLHKTAPKAETVSKPAEKKLELSEGQSSGIIKLED